MIYKHIWTKTGGKEESTNKQTDMTNLVNNLLSKSKDYKNRVQGPKIQCLLKVKENLS